jgi:transcription elongation factor GreA-like protein
LATWYIYFYSAITHLENRLYKAALLDYAVAFETFLESYLMTRLSSQYSNQIAEYLLKRSWRVENRCKELLKLATQRSLSEQKDLYDLWGKYVRRPRNELAHGKRLTIDQAHAEKAHQIVYQSVKWI